MRISETTSGSIASVSMPIGKIQHRGKGVYPNEKGGNLFTGKKTKYKKISEYISWDSLGSSLTTEDKMTIIEELEINKSLSESNDEDMKEYFTSLFEMSDELIENKNYIVVPLALVANRIMTLDSPAVMKFIHKIDNSIDLLFNNSGEKKIYPYGVFRDKAIFNTFTFASSDAYNKFRTVIVLKFEIDLPAINIKESIQTKESNMKKTKEHVILENSWQQFKEAKLDEEDIIVVPGQGNRYKPGFIPRSADRTDHEVEMAKSDLFQSAKNAKEVYEMIKDIPETVGLEGWVQEKIIKANDYLNTVREYLEHKQVGEVSEGASYKSDYIRRREREEAIISGQKPARKRAPNQTSDYAKRREQEKKAEQGVVEGYDSSKPFGVRYKVFAGKEGRITTKEYWTTSQEKLDKAVAKIEALDNFYEIDGYNTPEDKSVTESKIKGKRK